MKRAIVVGSGAGGATVAKELQGAFDVTVLEAGRAFRPFGWSLPLLETFKKARLLPDERLISLFFPAMRVRKTRDGMVLVNGVGVGGTTTLCTMNALRMDHDLRALGIDLDAEFAAAYREVPVTTAHRRRWRGTTRRLFETSQDMGLDPHPAPKMFDPARCVNCGRCVLGCAHGAKWDVRRFLDLALDGGARLVTGCRAERVVTEDGRVTGVLARQGWQRRFYPADLVVLAAGGLGTPAILERSGLACQRNLFVDPVLCVAARWPDSRQCHELSMPFIVQREHFILAPYFDYLSFFFNRDWRFPARDTLSLMIKLADTGAGTPDDKRLSAQDRRRLDEGVRLCKEILRHLGVPEGETFVGTVNAGHPGGMLPLTAREASTFHHAHLPGNLYVADATLLPRALGNPPILTVIAMAKRVSRLCIQGWC
jgi:choline dehydrogenase-like flavoprotein